jgi:threonine dehydratase
MVTLADIRIAQDYLNGKVRRTPLKQSYQLGRITRPATNLWLKAENLQKTGSFKPRGVLYKLSQLTPEERERGLITVSAGNTAQALAWAATVQGIRCTVIVPAIAPLSKTEAATAYGADVVRHGNGHHDCWELAYQLIAEHGLTLIHPYDDAAMIAGHGTIGLEIFEDLPDVDIVLVPVSGGALLNGVGIAIKSQRPDVQVIGVEPEVAPHMARALEAGHPVDIGQTTTIADGLRAPFVGNLNFELAQQSFDSVALISEDAIRCAVGLILQRTKLVVEPAGAITVAALLEGKIDLSAGAKVVAVLSGGNIDRATLAEILAASKPANHP